MGCVVEGCPIEAKARTGNTLILLQKIAIP